MRQDSQTEPEDGFRVLQAAFSVAQPDWVTSKRTEDVDTPLKQTISEEYS